MTERSSILQKLEDNQGTRMSFMRLTSARLSVTEKDRLNDLFHGATFSRSRVTNPGKAAQANVMPPDIEYTLLFDSLEATSFSAKPHWLRFIAAHRAVFSVSPVPMRVCESAYAKYVFAREHDPMLAMLVKLSVGLDAELDPRLCAREHHDAEPWYY